MLSAAKDLAASFPSEGDPSLRLRVTWEGNTSSRVSGRPQDFGRPQGFRGDRKVSGDRKGRLYIFLEAVSNT